MVYNPYIYLYIYSYRYVCMYMGHNFLQTVNNAVWSAKKLPSTSDILFSSINFIILSNNMTMRILSEVTFPSEKKKKKLSSWNSKRLLDYWQVNQVSNDMQHPEYEWWTKFQTSTDLTSNWAQQEGSACIPQIYFLQTKLPCAYICIPLYNARLWELWTETDQPKGVENMYAEGSYATVTYVKEIKLYLVISTITSSLKQFQQLF